MAPNYGPKIVRDGLVLALDAANPKSYPGSGTTCNDLGKNSYSGTLISGVGFDSSNEGSFVFDGVDDKIVFSNLSELDFPGDFTISFFAKQNPNVTQGNGRLISNGAFNQYGYEVFVDTNSVTLRTYSPGGYSSHDTGVNTSTWKYYSFIKSSSSSEIRILPDETVSSGNATDCVYNNHNFTIGTRSTSDSYFYAGNLGPVQCYNRAITASEVYQNYNALRGRYGI